MGVSEMMSPTGVATPRVLTSYEFSADNVTGLGIPHPSVHILSDSVRCVSVVIYRPDVFCPDYWLAIWRARCRILTIVCSLSKLVYEEDHYHGRTIREKTGGCIHRVNRMTCSGII